MGWFFENAKSEHFGDFVGGDRGQASRARSIFLKAGKAFYKKAPAPAGGFLYGNGAYFGDLQVLLSVGYKQDYPSPLGYADLTSCGRLPKPPGPFVVRRIAQLAERHA